MRKSFLGTQIELIFHIIIIHNDKNWRSGMLISCSKLAYMAPEIHNEIQWNLYVKTTSIMKYITCDLFNSVF